MLILAWQTMQLTQQVKVANAAATYNSHVGVMQFYHEVLKVLIDQPHLRPYFLAGKPCPLSDPNRTEAVLIAEMIADVHELGLQHTRKIPERVHRDCWPASVIASLEQPILNEVLRTPRPWYPELRMFFESTDRTKLPAPVRQPPQAPPITT
ncbi:hypothetical protein O7627_33015 [Solwaraspora sp. WMMD1047]|uniref:hypothetical protein n=1 Tax=Solwaraspora sp. WMMD1047 TaxID=3016102 RepID=UPI002416A14F|nr:hypothetical protein [Solwaraspora sp. WMMD1047]MDG4834086.1 hypothetical protein [Solwaraspora sp. WMMD1047]